MPKFTYCCIHHLITAFNAHTQNHSTVTKKKEEWQNCLKSWFRADCELIIIMKDQIVDSNNIAQVWGSLVKCGF